MIQQATPRSDSASGDSPVRGAPTSQAKPLTRDLLNKLISRCDPGTAQGLRNLVLLNLGYETMRRRSELVSFEFDDLRESAQGAQGILLKRSKTDPDGHGKVIPISDNLRQPLAKWFDDAGPGKILRSVAKDGMIGESLSPESVNRILKQLEGKVDKREKSLSGHSFRVGRTIDLINEGLSVEQIAIQGGWTSSEVVFRYAQSWNIK